MRTWLLAAILLVVAGEVQAYCLPWDHAATTFNASRDLNRVHPNLSNMTPNDTAIDSAPLLAAAIKYVIANRDCRKLVVDEGAYSFYKVTENKPKSAYVLIENASNLDIDLRGANLVFKESFYSAFYINNCNSCTLSNFSIDYQHLPFTQLNVTKVTWEEIIAVPQPNWPTVDQLYRHQSGVTGQFESLLFQGFETRGGVPQYDYTAWTLLMPIPPFDASHPHRITLGPTGKPQRVIQEGDVFIVAARGGGPAIYEENSAGTTFQNITIYTSGGPGIESWASKAMSFIAIQIVPNAGRLVSTVAGGIQLNNMTGPGNVVRNCLIIGAQDDSIAGNMSAPRVSATAAGGGINISTKPPPNPVFFVNGTTGETIGGPPTGQQYKLTQSTGTTYSVDPPLTAKQVNAFGTSLVYSWDQFAVEKTVIVQDNSIWYSYLARGIAFVGVSGVEITHNVVVATQQAGILVETDLVPSGTNNDFTNGPANKTLIAYNHLLATNLGMSGVGPKMLGAIEIMAYGTDGNVMSEQVNRELVLNGNTVSITQRAGIWIGNTRGVVVNDKANAIGQFGMAGRDLGNTPHLDNGLLPYAHTAFTKAVLGWCVADASGTTAMFTMCHPDNSQTK